MKHLNQAVIPNSNSNDSSNPFCESGSSPPAANDNVETQVPPVPCRDDAEKFIAALAGDINAQVTFQTFHDSEKKSDGRILHGTLRQHWDQLVALNKGGHGIYIMVNTGDGQGRTKANVTGLRSVFIDDDGKGPEPVAYRGEGHGECQGRCRMFGLGSQAELLLT